MTKVSMTQLNALIARADELMAQGKKVTIAMDVLNDHKIPKGDKCSSTPTYERIYETR